MQTVTMCGTCRRVTLMEVRQGESPLCPACSRARVSDVPEAHFDAPPAPGAIVPPAASSTVPNWPGRPDLLPAGFLPAVAALAAGMALVIGGVAYRSVARARDSEPTRLYWLKLTTLAEAGRGPDTADAILALSTQGVDPRAVELAEEVADYYRSSTPSIAEEEPGTLADDEAPGPIRDLVRRLRELDDRIAFQRSEEEADPGDVPADTASRRKSIVALEALRRRIAADLLDARRAQTSAARDLQEVRAASAPLDGQTRRAIIQTSSDLSRRYGEAFPAFGLNPP